MASYDYSFLPQLILANPDRYIYTMLKSRLPIAPHDYVPHAKAFGNNTWNTILLLTYMIVNISLCIYIPVKAHARALTSFMTAPDSPHNAIQSYRSIQL